MAGGWWGQLHILVVLLPTIEADSYFVKMTATAKHGCSDRRDLSGKRSVNQDVGSRYNLSRLHGAT